MRSIEFNAKAHKNLISALQRSRLEFGDASHRQFAKNLKAKFRIARETPLAFQVFQKRKTVRIIKLNREPYYIVFHFNDERILITRFQHYSKRRS